MNLVSDIKDMY